MPRSRPYPDGLTRSFVLSKTRSVSHYSVRATPHLLDQAPTPAVAVRRDGPAGYPGSRAPQRGYYSERSYTEQKGSARTATDFL